MPPADVALRFLAAFEHGDATTIGSLMAENVRHEHNTALGSDCVGREEYLRRLPHFLDAFAERRYRVDDVVSEARGAVTDVVVRYRFRARYAGSPIEIPGIMWMTIREGVIARRVDTFDSMVFLRQTGQTNAPSADVV